ncbi:hypothetical protein DFJ58DRAFT_723982 [Suillus subalutaceus]|uniref:uncharacterized protein n=1 Tax=Suillus subalutaceus TaxID=48586 RepID=UPI001B86C87D|nr:uncharacterized protein DFJ58DRAFT_723982 [Suillus subalutaceus]KAG1866485.1 hypothetical protein DFJ58DRAFT_723982 [Suillus subalutaceus]
MEDPESPKAPGLGNSFLDTTPPDNSAGLTLTTIPSVGDTSLASLESEPASPKQYDPPVMRVLVLLRSEDLLLTVHQANNDLNQSAELFYNLPSSSLESLSGELGAVNRASVSSNRCLAKMTSMAVDSPFSTDTTRVGSLPAAHQVSSHPGNPAEAVLDGHLPTSLPMKNEAPATPTLQDRAFTPYYFPSSTNQQVPVLRIPGSPPSDVTSTDSSHYHVPPPSTSSSLEDGFFLTDSSDYGTECSDYTSDEDDPMDDYALPTAPPIPHETLGDFLIAKDKKGPSTNAMPSFIHVLTFDATTHSMIADPPSYDTAISSPYRGVHLAASIVTETSEHTVREVSKEKSRYLANRPPAIYHYNHADYPSHVVTRTDTTWSRYFAWRRICRLHTDLLKQVQSALTTEQAKDCNDHDLCIILIERNHALPAWVNRAAFLMQHAPFCNPFLTRHEATFLHLASSYLHFYGYGDATRAIDHVLQLTVPDEDVVNILLQELLLDTSTALGLSPTNRSGNS